MTKEQLEREIACIQAAFDQSSPIDSADRAEVIRGALVRTYIRTG